MAAGEQQHVGPQVAQPGDHPVGAGADLGQALAARTAVAEQLPIPAAPSGCPRWSGPRRRRSSTPPGRDRPGQRRPNPASSAVRRARCKGLVKTCGKLRPRSRSPQAFGVALAALVRGMSVRPVCWPETVQAVSPCRAR